MLSRSFCAIALVTLLFTSCSPQEAVSTPTEEIAATEVESEAPEPSATIKPSEEIVEEAPANVPILFSASIDNPDEINIYSLDPDSGELLQLTEGFSFSVAPQWCPEYQHIAFSSNDGGEWRVYVMEGDGSDLQMVTDFSSAIPDWFPEGERLIFNSDSRLEPRDTPDLYAMNLDGSDLVEVIDLDETADYDGHVTPDGKQVVFVSTRTGVNHITVADIDGSNLVQLTSGEIGNTSPDISPDGQWILFTRYSPEGTDLYKIRLDGSELTQVTDMVGEEYDGAWSPDGERIAFVSSTQQFPFLFVMNADGSDMQQITAGEYPVIAPSWH